LPIEGYTNALFPEAEKSLEFFPAWVVTQFL